MPSKAVPFLLLAEPRVGKVHKASLTESTDRRWQDPIVLEGVAATQA